MISIKLDLTTQDMDLIFLCLQRAPMTTVTYSDVDALLKKLLAQGRPQLEAQRELEAMEQEESQEEIKPGGTD